MTMLTFETFVSGIAATIARLLPAEPAQGASDQPAVAQAAVEHQSRHHEKIVWHFPDVSERLMEEAP